MEMVYENGKCIKNTCKSTEVVRKTFWAKTYGGIDTRWPGTADNPMRPELYKHPISGGEQTAHYNGRNLSSNRDYEDAGFEWIDGRGWCYPVEVEVPSDCKILNKIAL
jgi:hypothetical protein